MLNFDKYRLCFYFDFSLIRISGSISLCNVKIFGTGGYSIVLGESIEPLYVIPPLL